MKNATSEKRVLAIAVLVSLIVCLAFHFFGQVRKMFQNECQVPVVVGAVAPEARQGGGPGGMGGMGGMRSRQPATPELLAQYNEQAKLADALLKASAKLTVNQQALAQIRANEMQIQLFRRANNLRVTPGVDAYMRLAVWQKAGESYAKDTNTLDALQAQYELVGAQIKVAELPERISGNEDFQNAVKDYLAGKIDLDKLLTVEAELAAPGR